MAAQQHKHRLKLGAGPGLQDRIQENRALQGEGSKAQCVAADGLRESAGARDRGLRGSWLSSKPSRGLGGRDWHCKRIGQAHHLLLLSSPCAGAVSARCLRLASARTPTAARAQGIPPISAAAPAAVPALPGGCPAALPTGWQPAHGCPHHVCPALPSAGEGCCHPLASSRHAGSWRCLLAGAGRHKAMPARRCLPGPRAALPLALTPPEVGPPA